jgi:hypothetical protein
LSKGKINKLKNFKLDGVENNSNLKGVKSPKEDIQKILNGKTVWILCPKELEKRTLSATNPESINNLTNEEDKEKCKIYISIIKNELGNLNTIHYFKECLDL